MGIFVVDPGAISRFASATRTEPSFETDNGLVSDPRIRQEVYSSIVKLADDRQLNEEERPKQFLLLNEPFTVESDVLTPTMKLRRHVAKKVYNQELQLLYSLPVLRPYQQHENDFQMGIAPARSPMSPGRYTKSWVEGQNREC